MRSVWCSRPSRDAVEESSQGPDEQARCWFAPAFDDGHRHRNILFNRLFEARYPLGQVIRYPFYPAIPWSDVPRSAQVEHLSPGDLG